MIKFPFRSSLFDMTGSFSLPWIKSFRAVEDVVNRYFWSRTAFGTGVNLSNPSGANPAVRVPKECISSGRMMRIRAYVSYSGNVSVSVSLRVTVPGNPPVTLATAVLLTAASPVRATLQCDYMLNQVLEFDGVPFWVLSDGTLSSGGTGIAAGAPNDQDFDIYALRLAPGNATTICRFTSVEIFDANAS